MRPGKGWTTVLTVFALIVALIAAHPLYLGALGNFLVVPDPLTKSDALVVLDGETPKDERLLYAVGLWQRGYAPRIILSARLEDWMTYEDYPGWRHAMKLKILPDGVLSVAGHDADSTKQEARKLLPYIQQYGYAKVIIVTSNYHTRRAKRVFKEEWAGSGIHVLFAAAADRDFHPGEWWRHRADSRTFYYEFSKLIWYTLME